MKVGLVLEGGGMRGIYTAGVLDALMDNNIKIDGIIGTSAGAIFGVNYFSKQRGRIVRYNKRFCKEKKNISIHSLVTTGNIINKEFAFYKVPFELDVFDDEEYKKATKEYYATVTNVKTGEAEHIKIDSVYDQMEALRASAAIPLVSKIVELDGKKYLDGGIGDSIPVEKMLSLDYDKIIVVLTQPKDYIKKPLSKGKEKMTRLMYKDYPNFIESMLNRHERYNKTIERIIDLENKKEIFVIRPSVKLNISVMERDENNIEEVYRLGLKEGNESIQLLKEYLNK